MQFALRYTEWHYSRGVQDLIVMWSNFIWFLTHFFSIPLLISTLFSPWKRLRENRKAGFNFEDLLAVLVVNVIMRLFGFCMRLSIIAIGLVVLTLTAACMLLALVAWLLWPLLIGGLVFFGLKLLLI